MFSVTYRPAAMRHNGGSNDEANILLVHASMGSGENGNLANTRRTDDSSGASTSETAKPEKNGHAKQKQKSKQPFFARLFRSLGCISDPQVPLDDHPKNLDKDEEKAEPAEKQENPINVLAVTTAPAPTLNADGSVVLPPTPSNHLLPKSETEGLTSGAVQPPGSTGTPRVSTSQAPDTTGTPNKEGTPAPEQHTESDASYSDEDEDEEILSADEEEERLILNGGSGIPIGPVT